MPRLRVTPAVVIASAVAFAAAAVLAGVSVFVAVMLTTGGDLHADTHDALQMRGVATTIVGCAYAAAALVIGGIRALRGRRGRAAIGACAVIVFAGLIGETIEALTGGTASSLAIGAGIIAVAALPAILLLLPRPAVADVGGRHAIRA